MKLILLLLIVSCATTKKETLEVINIPSNESIEIVKPKTVTRVELHANFPSNFKTRGELLAKKADCLLNDDLFLSEILAHGDFSDSKASDVVKEIVKSKSKTYVTTYYSFFTKAVAYREANTIYLNTAKWNKRNDNSWVGTIIHEFLHTLGYTHSFNPTKKDLEGVNYKVGDLATKSKSFCMGIGG